MAADDGARLQLMRKERNQKQTQLDTLVNNRRQRLAALLNCAPTGWCHTFNSTVCLEPGGLMHALVRLQASGLCLKSNKIATAWDGTDGVCMRCDPAPSCAPCIPCAHHFRFVDGLPCAAAIPEADKLKAVVDGILQNQEKELSKQASELQKMQGQASTTQGALTACQTQLNQQQHEVETLQNSVQASLSQIYNVVQAPLLSLIPECQIQQPLLRFARNETPQVALNGP